MVTSYKPAFSELNSLYRNIIVFSWLDATSYNDSNSCLATICLTFNNNGNISW